MKQPGLQCGSLAVYKHEVDRTTRRAIDGRLYGLIMCHSYNTKSL